MIFYIFHINNNHLNFYNKMSHLAIDKLQNFSELIYLVRKIFCRLFHLKYPQVHFKSHQKTHPFNSEKYIYLIFHILFQKFICGLQSPAIQ